MFDLRGGPAHAATREGAHTRFEFLQRKGLGHVVVSAVVQALDALFDAVGSGEDQHRQGRAACTQALEHFQAVQPGQPQVQNQQVEFVVGHQRCIGFRAAGHMVHGGPGAAQAAQQTVGEYLVVFGNQNSHVCLLCPWPSLWWL